MSASTTLSEADWAYLNGEHGPGAQLAMRVLVAVAKSMDAPTLVDVHSAHVDGCLYVGSVSIDFVRALVDGSARVSVPTTLNVGSVDLRHPQYWNGPEELATKARTLMDLYAQLGCTPTWTCAPYLLANRPTLGQHIAWGESNAIVFANSVLGARTQRYGDFVDIAAAIVGRAPFAGLHTDEGRRGQILIDVTALPAVGDGPRRVLPAARPPGRPVVRRPRARTAWHHDGNRRPAQSLRCGDRLDGSRRALSCPRRHTEAADADQVFGGRAPSRPSRLRLPTCVGHGLSSAPAGTDSWRPSASARPTSRFRSFTI